MLASIDKQRNIEIFYTAEEVERLPAEVVRGTIISLQNPKDQGEISLSLDKTVSKVFKERRKYGAGVHENRERIAVFLADLFYPRLKRGIPFEVKYGLDSKVKFANINYTNSHEQIRAKELGFWIKAKDKSEKAKGFFI